MLQAAQILGVHSPFTYFFLEYVPGSGCSALQAIRKVTSLVGNSLGEIGLAV